MLNRLTDFLKLVAPLLGALVVAIVPIFIKQFLPEKININKWWVWGIGGFFGAIFVYWSYTGDVNYGWGLAGFLSAISFHWIYKRYWAFPFKKYRVTCLEDDEGHVIEGKKDGRGLITRKSAGRPDGNKWIFKGRGIWGPYIPLSHGFYRASFKISVTNLDVFLDDRPVLEIDVASHCRKDGDKQLALRVLTTHDLKKDKLVTFPLEFFIVGGERRVEFRVKQRESEYIMVLDHVKLSRAEL